MLPPLGPLHHGLAETTEYEQHSGRSDELIAPPNGACASDLDSVAAFTADMQAVLADCADDWDFIVTTQAIKAHDWETIAGAHILLLP